MADHERLAQAVKERRLAMGGLTQSQAASAAGVSDTTWNQVEAGKPVSPRSLAKISQALWVDPMAAATILDGGQPPTASAELGAVSATAYPDVVRLGARGDATTTQLLQAVRDLTQAVQDLREDMRRGRR